MSKEIIFPFCRQFADFRTDGPSLVKCDAVQITIYLRLFKSVLLDSAIRLSPMDIYLIRVSKSHEGTLFVERKPSATTSDDYIAISHVWGTPETIQPTHVAGIADPVQLSPGKKDILSILNRPDVCGENWFWMDLLCIDQRPDATISIAEQLMAIPAVYRSSRCVKVLIESPVCEAWQATAARVAAEPTTDVELYKEEELRHARRCSSMLFCDPWFERLWTRQEGLYGMTIDVITLNRVACQRLQPLRVNTARQAWTAEGGVMEKRNAVSFFLDDKLAYHGMSMADYGGAVGPHYSYSPLSEAWRSGRVTTKERDYVLAIFPDIAGYRVPPDARKMKFDALLKDALGQVANQRRFYLTPKIPRGMIAETSSKESAQPWLPEKPANISEALDGLMGYFADEPKPEAAAKFFNLASNISFEDAPCTKEGFAELRTLWETTVDTIRHMAYVHPAGPCTGIARANVQTDEGLLHLYFVQELVPTAVARHLTDAKFRKMELRTTGVLTFERVQHIPDETFARELRRFLVCLLCGTTLRTADIVLEAADLVSVPTKFGRLLALVNQGARRMATPENSTLVCTATSQVQGFLLAVRKDTGAHHMVGRTVIIPDDRFWDALES